MCDNPGILLISHFLIADLYEKDLFIFCYFCVWGYFRHL